MAAWTPDYMRGLLLLDPLFTDANSGTGTSVTQRGPEPDQPQPDSGNAGYLELRQTGEALATTDYEVRVASAGTAGRDDLAGTFLWRESTETLDTAWRGWHSYRIPSRFGTVDYTTSSPGFRNPHAVAMADHTIVVSYHDRDADEVRVAHRAADATSWTTVTVRATPVSTSSGTVYDIPTCLVVVPRDGGERLILFHVTLEAQDNSGGDDWRLQNWYSDDAGATWAAGARNIQGWSLAAVADTVFRLRAVFHDGYITFALDGVETATQKWWHLVSRDVGATVELIEAVNVATHDLGYIDLHVLPSGSVLWVYLDTSVVTCATMDGPYATIPDVEDFDTAVGALSTLTATRFASAMAPDGNVYIITTRLGAGDRHDFGVINVADPSVTPPNASRYGQRGAFDTADTTEVLFDHGSSRSSSCLVAAQGSLHWIGQVTSSGPGDESLYWLVLGGYSSIDWRDWGCDFNWAVAVNTEEGSLYLPFSDPSTWAGFTWAKTGSPTLSITSTGFRIQDGGGAADATTTERDAGVSQENRVVWWACDVDAGGSFSTTAAELGVRIEIDDGADSWEAAVNLTTTGVQLTDLGGTSEIGSVTGLAEGPREYVLITSRDGSDDPYVRLWYRLRPNNGLWIEVGGAQLTQAASAAANGDTEWGHISNDTGRDSRWEMFAISGFVDHGRILAAEQGSTWWPDGLIGRVLTANPLYLEEGRQLSAAASAAYSGDLWDVNTRYEHGIELLDPQVSPSPSVAWESTGTTEALIEWSFDDDHRILNGTIGLHLGGINFRTAVLEGWNGSSWVPLATLDASTDLSGLTFDRTGDMVTANSGSSAAGRYIQLDELVGYTLVIDPGGEDEAARLITANSEGVWDGTHSRPPLLTIEGTLSGLLATGSCRILHTSITVVIHDVSTAFDKWRIRVPASQPTISGRYQIGTALLGPVMLFGQQYSWGRQLEDVPNVQLTTGRAGRRTSDLRGDARRVVQFSWRNIDLTPVSGSSPSPDHLEPRATLEPAGIRHDGHLAKAMLRRTQGAHRPVVYLPSIPEPGAQVTVQQFTGIEEHMYGRVVSPVTATSINGNENADEVIAVDAVVIEEEL